MLALLRACLRPRAPPMLSLAVMLALCGRAAAHDFWPDGEKVPAWIKSACCGPADFHHLRPDQVHLTKDGYRVDDYPDLIPIAKALPSPDGEYYIFYRALDNGDKTMVYCFFVPFSSG